MPLIRAKQERGQCCLTSSAIVSIARYECTRRKVDMLQSTRAISMTAMADSISVMFCPRRAHTALVSVDRVDQAAGRFFSIGVWPNQARYRQQHHHSLYSRDIHSP